MMTCFGENALTCIKHDVSELFYRYFRHGHSSPDNHAVFLAQRSHVILQEGNLAGTGRELQIFIHKRFHVLVIFFCRRAMGKVLAGKAPDIAIKQG